MSVTQDYKILTLTVCEKVAVELALARRVRELQQSLDEAEDTEQEMRCSELLESAASAYAKVCA